MLNLRKKRMNKYDKAIIDRIEQALRDLDWKPADLARASNLTETAISKILNGERRAGEKSLPKIADALGIPREEMFRLAGWLPEIKGDRQEAKDLLDYLDPDEFDRVWEYMRWRINEQGKKSR